jgi:hypothetical protein
LNKLVKEKKIESNWFTMLHAYEACDSDYSGAPYEMGHQGAMSRMTRALSRDEFFPEPQRESHPVTKSLPNINIALIGAAPFRRYMKKKNAEVFTVLSLSLNEID